MLNKMEFPYASGITAYNTVMKSENAFFFDNKRLTEEEIYSDIHNNRERISDHIANKVSARFKQSLIEKGLLSEEKAED